MRTTALVKAFLLLFIGQICYTQTISPPYEVGTWQGFRSTAVSFTFDDNTPKQFTKAIPIFNDFDFNLTLFIVTDPGWGWAANWNTLREAAAQGHEVASHTVTHTSFSGMEDSLQDTELKDSRDEIETQIPDHQCITLAYPYCVASKKSITEQVYSAARICSGSIVPKSPKDFMNISSIICGTEGSVKTAEHFISKADLAARSNGWCVYLLHGVDDDGGWSSVPSTVIQETLEHFKAHDETYWVETFGNVTRYIKERDALSVEETSVQDTLITLQVTDTLDNVIFNHPVTLRRPLPDNWPSATVVQNGVSVKTKIVD
ncbi:polysaccharide deacetylase family protein, partial [bacterium]